jgi:hypothetical protein
MGKSISGHSITADILDVPEALHLRLRLHSVDRRHKQEIQI